MLHRFLRAVDPVAHKLTVVSVPVALSRRRTLQHMAELQASCRAVLEEERLSAQSEFGALVEALPNRFQSLARNAVSWLASEAAPTFLDDTTAELRPTAKLVLLDPSRYPGEQRRYGVPDLQLWYTHKASSVGRAVMLDYLYAPQTLRVAQAALRTAQEAGDAALDHPVIYYHSGGTAGNASMEARYLAQFPELEEQQQQSSEDASSGGDGAGEGDRIGGRGSAAGVALRLS